MCRTQKKQDEIDSRGYPLTINNLATRAMNMTVEMGEEKVSAEVVMSL